MLGAALCSAAAPAGANPVESLQQQAAALSRQMLLEQLQIDGFQQQRAEDMSNVAAEGAQLQQLQTQLGATRHRIGEDLSQLRGAAVKAYVEGGTAVDGTSALFASSPSDGASTVYTEVLTGSLTTAEVRLQSDRRLLRTEEARQEQVAAQAQHQLNGADLELEAAQSTQQRLSEQRAGVSGDLAAVIAQEQAEEAAARAPVAPSVPSSAPAAAASSTDALPQLNAFLSCVIQAESGGDYQAISPTGQYMGAFQFSQPTWNEAAQLAGIPTLVGVQPYTASARDQDLLAIALYNADGEQPWYDPCTS